MNLTSKIPLSNSNYEPESKTKQQALLSNMGLSMDKENKGY